jgi:hypothetical protein
MATPTGRPKKNTRDGQFIAQVEALGWVPYCVQDAFSWLPHPWGRANRTKPLAWFWEPYGDPPPPILDPQGGRCIECIFQEPPWSQSYARCSHSWLHDHDGDCQAFFARSRFLDLHPAYTDFCRPPSVPLQLLDRPYRHDGTPYGSYRPTANLPSGYCAWLNYRQWWDNGAAGLYSATQNERLRRFWQWAADRSIEESGAYQPNLFLGM